MTDLHQLRRAVVLSAPTTTVLRVDGAGIAAIDRLLPCDVWLRDGQIKPTVLLRADGTVAADVWLLCDGDDHWLLADGVTAPALADALGHPATDVRQTHDLLAIDGPFAWELLAAWDEPGAVGLPLLSFYDAGEVRVIRAGRTGEYGYTLVVPRARTAAVADALLALGERYGIRRVGLDTIAHAVLEAGFVDPAALPVHLDPRELQLQWRITRGKAAHGTDALAARPFTRRVTAFRGPAPVSVGAAVMLGEEAVGTVLSCAPDAVRGVIGLLLLDLPVAVVGIEGVVGDTVVRTVSRPAIANRSLYVRPQRHTWADAPDLPYPYPQ